MVACDPEQLNPSCRPNQCHEKDSSQNGDQNTGDKSASRVEAKEMQYPSADHTARDAKSDVYEGTVSRPLHDFPSRPTGDEAHQNYPEYPHRQSLSFCRKKLESLTGKLAPAL